MKYLLQNDLYEQQPCQCDVNFMCSGKSAAFCNSNSVRDNNGVRV